MESEQASPSWTCLKKESYLGCEVYITSLQDDFIELYEQYPIKTPEQRVTLKPQKSARVCMCDPLKRLEQERHEFQASLGAHSRILSQNETREGEHIALRS